MSNLWLGGKKKGTFFLAIMLQRYVFLSYLQIFLLFFYQFPCFLIT